MVVKSLQVLGIELAFRTLVCSAFALTHRHKGAFQPLKVIVTGYPKLVFQRFDNWISIIRHGLAKAKLCLEERNHVGHFNIATNIGFKNRIAGRIAKLPLKTIAGICLPHDLPPPLHLVGADLRPGRALTGSPSCQCRNALYLSWFGFYLNGHRSLSPTMEIVQ